jgi:hypothetical protein
MDIDIDALYAEISKYLSESDIEVDGEHMWSNYQKNTAILIRLQQIHNDLSYLEVIGKASADVKKFRTAIVDPTIERFDKISAYESRKITAKNIEAQLDR